MKTRELMVEKVVTLEKDTSVQDAAKKMNQKGIGCLVAMDDGSVVGILTERDLLKRVVETCKNPRDTSVSEVMTRNVIIGDPDMRLADAAKLMFEHNIKKLPIVKDNQLVGIVTLTDIARALNVDEKTKNLVEALSNMHLSSQSNWKIDGPDQCKDLPSKRAGARW